MHNFFAFIGLIRKTSLGTGLCYDKIIAMRSIYIRGDRFSLEAVQRVDYFYHNSSTQTKWNQHNGIELHFVLKGSLIWEFKDGTPTIAVNGGMMAAIPAGKIHRVIDGTVNPAIRLGLILRSPQDSITETTLNSSEFTTLCDAISQSAGKALLMPRGIQNLTAKFRSFMENFSPDDMPSILRLRFLTALLLSETAGEMAHPQTPRESIHDMKSLIALVNKTPEISLDELINRSGYGRTRFFTLFQETTGTSPCEHINRMRIKKAKKLIRSKQDYPLSRIAKMTGFASSSAFANVFRRYVGTSARKYAQSL